MPKWDAPNAINQALEIRDNETTTAYQSVRSALIQSVRDNHPEYPREDPENIEENYLFKIASFLKSFQAVISLNYDLLVYWAVHKSNQDNKEIWFKDCWNNGLFDKNWQKFREPYNNAKGATLVFYPHGNLILASRWNGQEEKIKQENRLDLRATIIQRWESGEYIPLFVSEGTSNHKKKAIKQSDYLTIVYDEVLPNVQKNLVIFGWSMSDQDTHILEVINKAKPEKIAISIYRRNEDNDETIRQKCQNEREKLGRYSNLRSILDNNNIYFFDSASPDFWINNNEV